MRVTRRNYPTVFEALDTISHDGGGQCWDWYDVPEPWARELADFERGLYPLSVDDLQTFCVGEQDNMIAIMAAHGLDRASNFLSEFFSHRWARGRA